MDFDKIFYAYAPCKFKLNKKRIILSCFILELCYLKEFIWEKLFSVFPLRFWCVSMCPKINDLACLTMEKLKINRGAPNKNADLLKKISLMGTETVLFYI